MATLKIVTLGHKVRQVVSLISIPAILLSLLFAAVSARGAAYYSTGAPTKVAPVRKCTFNLCGNGVDVADAGATAGGITLAATVYLPSILDTSPAILRLKLNGKALAGYRAGMLLSNSGAVLNLNALGSVTLRTYLSSGATPEMPQEQKVVAVGAAQVQLLSANGQPEQVEFVSTKDFDQVEIEFAQVPLLNSGAGVNVNYAYGIGANQSEQVSGFISRFSTGSTGRYNVGGSCPGAIVNAGNAVDTDLTNYASFASLLSVGCTGQLRVSLEGTAPSTSQAGFVIGRDNSLLDASLLGGLVLRTYLNGVLQESGSGASLLGLSVLPDGKSLVSFPATKPFDAVSIERVDGVSLADNLQLYYGVGVASTTITPPVTSSFPAGTTSSHYKTWTNGVLCACGVTNPSNATSPSQNSPATLQVAAGVASSTGMQVDLNGPGKAGNRAGMVIGRSSLLDVAALSRITLVTYDENGKVLETASGSSLLTLNTLPNGRQTLSFNTTRDFAKVGIQMTGVLGVADNTDIYYGFADDSNGTLSIVNPTPLPVSLTSFAVRRLAGSGAADITWTTASELNSASFVVERSANPTAGFEAIGQVAATGNSNTTRQYSLRDAKAATQPGLLYYRLRQVDADGRATLSQVAVLPAGPALASFTLYPNPASGTTQQVTLGTSTDLAVGYSVDVYSGLGQLLSSRQLSSESIAAPLTISTAGLAAGIYHVVLRNTAGQPVTAQRLVVTGR